MSMDAIHGREIADGDAKLIQLGKMHALLAVEVCSSSVAFLTCPRGGNY